MGWWDDRPLDPAAADDHAPRIDVDGDGTASLVAIAFTRGAGAAWLATSTDGGCTFDMRPVSPAAGSVDRDADVAISRSRGVVALAFVRDGAVVAVASADGGRTFAAAPDVLAARSDASTRPRVALAPVDGAVHVHVAWCEGGRIFLATSRAGGATGTWTTSAVSDRFVDFGPWIQLDLSADTRSRDALTESAVTIVAAGQALGINPMEVFSARSNDSGAAFYGDPADTLSRDLPRRVSALRRSAVDPAVAPVLDVSDDGTGEFYTWEAVGYDDREASAFGLRIDARAEEGAGP